MSGAAYKYRAEIDCHDVSQHFIIILLNKNKWENIVLYSLPRNSGKLDVQQTTTAIGCRNFAVSGPETWNSLPAELHLSTLSTATFAQLLKAHLFVSIEWHVPAVRLILLKAALLINIIIIIIIINGNFQVFLD